MDIEFKNVEELYKRVCPALRVKKRMLHKKGIEKSEKQIFEYLVKEKWSKSINLALNDIVNDILDVKDDVFKN